MALFAVECFIQVEDAQANGGPGRKGLAIHGISHPVGTLFQPGVSCIGLIREVTESALVAFFPDGLFVDCGRTTQHTFLSVR